MHVVVAKVDENLFEGEAASVTLPASEGVMTVLPRHMPLVTTLKKGTVVVHRDKGEGEPFTVEVEGGVLEVRRDGATVIL